MPQKRILVVEDNSINLRLVLMALQPMGHLLLSAATGEEGLKLAIKERPDLIIMDIQLPQVDGLEVVKRLRAMPQVANTPIIALTAYAMKGDRERILGAGCDAYLEKPIDTRELPKVVEKMLVHATGE